MKGQQMSEILRFMPTKEDILNLKVGDKALSCFGDWGTVTRIYARDVDRNGRHFICFYVEVGKLTVSQTYKEDKLLRTVPLTFQYNSAQLDVIEKEMHNERY